MKTSLRLFQHELRDKYPYLIIVERGRNPNTV